MKISAEQSRGIVGGTEPIGFLDTESLDPAQKKSVEDTVRAMRFFQLPGQLPGGEIGMDLQSKRITIEDAGKRHSVTFSDDAPGAQPLRKLLELLAG
jgi:hypothetical protein